MTLGAIPETRAPREDELEREEMFTSGRVIVMAVDHGQTCRTAFTWALDQFITHADTVHLLHVLPKHTGGVSSCMGSDAAGVDLQADATHLLFDTLGKEAYKKHHVKVVHVFRHGEPGKEICAEAVKSNAVSIIMGSRGMGFVDRVLIGSAAEYCVRHSSIPIVVVPHNYKSPGTADEVVEEGEDQSRS